MTDTPQTRPVTGSGLPAGETFYPVPYFFDVMDMPVTPIQACKSEPVTVPIRMEVIPLPGNSSPLMSFCGDGMKLLEELAGHEDFYCACLEASVAGDSAQMLHLLVDRVAAYLRVSPTVAGVYLKYPKYPPRAV